MLTKYRDILQDPDELPIDKLLYIVIGNKTTPWIVTATNKELAELLGATPRYIQRALHRLQRGGYIRIEYADKNNRILRHRGNIVRTTGDIKTTPTAPHKRQASALSKGIKRQFKKLYKEYTGETTTGVDYSALIPYQGLLKSGETTGTIHSWAIAYKNERISKGYPHASLDTYLQLHLYRGFNRPLSYSDYC